MKTETTERKRIIILEGMEKILYGIWLAVLGAMLVVCSLERSPVLIDGTVRTLCFGLFGMTVIWHLLLVVSGAFKNFSGQTKKTGLFSRKFRERLLQTAVFFLAAVLYWVYCFRLDARISTNSTMDALVAGSLLCAAAAVVEKCGETV